MKKKPASRELLENSWTLEADTDSGKKIWPFRKKNPAELQTPQDEEATEKENTPKKGLRLLFGKKTTRSEETAPLEEPADEKADEQPEETADEKTDELPEETADEKTDELPEETADEDADELLDEGQLEPCDEVISEMKSGFLPLNLFQELQQRLKKDPDDKPFEDFPVTREMRELIKKLQKPKYRNLALSYRLLKYLQECLDNGETPNWEDITSDTDSIIMEDTKKMRIYVLEHLLEEGKIEGIRAVPKVKGMDNFPEETFGIQITPKGSDYLQKNAGIVKTLDFVLKVLGAIPI